jgi:hypothetical protein
MCVSVGLCIPLSLVGNSLVKIFPQQRTVVGGVIFDAVCVISKESRLLVLPRTSGFKIRKVGHKALGSS